MDNGPAHDGNDLPLHAGNDPQLHAGPGFLPFAAVFSDLPQRIHVWNLRTEGITPFFARNLIQNVPMLLKRREEVHMLYVNSQLAPFNGQTTNMLRSMKTLFDQGLADIGEVLKQINALRQCVHQPPVTVVFLTQRPAAHLLYTSQQPLQLWAYASKEVIDMTKTDVDCIERELDRQLREAASILETHQTQGGADGPGILNLKERKRS